MAGAEPADAGGLADDLGRRDRPDAGRAQVGALEKRRAGLLSPTAIHIPAPAVLGRSAGALLAECLRRVDEALALHQAITPGPQPGPAARLRAAGVLARAAERSHAPGAWLAFTPGALVEIPVERAAGGRRRTSGAWWGSSPHRPGGGRPLWPAPPPLAA